MVAEKSARILKLLGNYLKIDAQTSGILDILSQVRSFNATSLYHSLNELRFLSHSFTVC